MSDGSSHRRTPGSLVVAAAILLLLVAVNLAMTVFSERLQHLLSPAVLQTVAFWGGWSLAALAALAGWFWSNTALERSDRDSTRRLRACFQVALTAVVLLAIGTFEEALSRAELAAIAAGVMALVLVPFALAARALNDGTRRRRRRSADEPA